MKRLVSEYVMKMLLPSVLSSSSSDGGGVGVRRSDYDDDMA